MQVKRFVAADMRRALELVRQDLGPDAIILSSNRIPEGVELLTTMGSDSELMQLQQQPMARLNLNNGAPLLSDGSFGATMAAERQAQAKAAPILDPKAEHPNRGKSGAQLADEIERARQRMIASRKAEESAKEFLTANVGGMNAGAARQSAALTSKSDAPARAAAKPKVGLSAAEKYPLVDDAPVVSLSSAAQKAEGTAVSGIDQTKQLSDLQAEIADMRFLLEQQLDRLTGQVAPAVDSPILGSVSRRLERLGLPQEVIGKVLTACSKTKTLADAWPDALANLAHQLPVSGRDIIDQGGVFALVGPTGVGKTTTIGKLAARYVLQHGADKVALVTTDTYRIAAHDQLRSLARILRVPVRVVDESNSLDSVLRSLRHCSLVLIDTAGFRHGDPYLKAQLSALAEQPQIKSYLVLSCNSQEQMLKASIHAYGAARLQGCILTKLDETASMGEALGVVMRNRLPIAYTTDGQDIPKNLDIARAHQLVSKAVALLKANPITAVS